MKFLKELLQINTKSGNTSGIENAFEIIKQEYSDLKGQFIHENGGLIFKSDEIDGTKSKIILSGHIDTVISAEEIPVNEENGKMYGSGAHDMKASIYVILESLRKLNKDKQLQNISVLISPEEEIASPNFRKSIQQYSIENDIALVFEPTIISNNIKERSIVVGRRGAQLYKLSLDGPGGHSGVITNQKDRLNTILEISKFIIMLESNADYEKLTTFNAGTINGGKIFNIIPPRCELTFEIRFKENLELVRMQQAIDQHLSKLDSRFNVTLEPGLSFPAMQESENNVVVKKIFHEVAVDQGITLAEEYRGGGSEASLFAFYNPELIVIDGLGAKGEGEHTFNEFVYTESVTDGIDYISEVIRKL